MRSRRSLLLALLPTVVALLGAPCNGNDTISLEGPQTVPPLTLFTLDVVVQVGQPVHAYEFSLEWDPSRLFGLGVVPDPDFDDGGGFFLTPTLDIGRLEGVVDLRHGEPGISGTFRVARVSFLSLDTPGLTTLWFTDGGVSTAGSNSPTLLARPGQVTVTP